MGLRIDLMQISQAVDASQVPAKATASPPDASFSTIASGVPSDFRLPVSSLYRPRPIDLASADLMQKNHAVVDSPSRRRFLVEADRARRTLTPRR